MIEVKNIVKKFGEQTVLKGVSTRFEAGMTNLIIGQSGSGKTVFLKSLLGIHTPDSGTISFDGRIYSELSNDERRELRTEIGMVFQGSALFDSMTVEENIGFPLKMFTNKSAKEIKERVDFVIDRVHLVNAHQKRPSEISGGMQKRVAIARAIVNNPKYLFCDEPNSGLDPQTANLIDDLIMELTKEYEMTTVVVTHDMNSVLEIGEKVYFLYKGKIWWSGDRDTILHSDNKELNAFVFSSDLTRRLKPTKK